MNIRARLPTKVSRRPRQSHTQFARRRSWRRCAGPPDRPARCRRACRARCAAIGQPGRGGRVGGDQRPGLRQIQHAAAGQHEGGAQHGRIVIIADSTVQMPASASVAADAQPRCEPPRTTLGLPITTASPASRRGAADHFLHREFADPRAQCAEASRVATVSSSWLAIGNPAARAAARDAVQRAPGTSRCARRRVRQGRGNRPNSAGALAVFRAGDGSSRRCRIDGVWSLKANRCTRPAAISARAMSSASRLYASQRRCTRMSQVQLRARQRVQQCPPGLEAAQARLPRQRDAVEGGGDAVGEQLRSVSASAKSAGKSTPGRGCICRSNASPWMSTMPGSTSRPRGVQLAGRSRRRRAPAMRPSASTDPPAQAAAGQQPRPPAIRIGPWLSLWLEDDLHAGRGVTRQRRTR